MQSLPSSKNMIFLKIGATLFYNCYNGRHRDFGIDFKRKSKKLIKIQINEEFKFRGRGGGDLTLKESSEKFS